MKDIRKSIQITTYYILPAILISGSLLLGNKWIYSKYGTAAFLLLALNLFLRPLSVLFSNKLLIKLSTYRRELGIASFWFYLFHSIGFFLLYGLSINSFLKTNSYLVWAAPAGISMWLLGVTSNDKSVKLLKKNWKRLHRLAYPLFYFSLIHSALAEREIEKIYIFGISFLILKIFEYRRTPFRW